MKLAKMILTFLIATTIVLAIPLHTVVATVPNEPHNADAMWLEPSVLNASDLSIGLKFNITVWLNTSVACGGWQFHLIYNKNVLNATGCGYTAGSKSELFQNVTATMPVDPQFMGINATYSYVEHGESWLSNSTNMNPGYGSLSWVEFQVMAAFTALPYKLDISTSHHPETSSTYALDWDTGDEIPLNVDDATIIPEFNPLLIFVIFSAITIIAVLASKALKPRLDRISIRK
jgi:hypothetical protein